METFLPTSTELSWPTRMAAENLGTPELAPIFTRPPSLSKSTMRVPSRARRETISLLPPPVSLIRTPSTGVPV